MSVCDQIPTMPQQQPTPPQPSQSNNNFNFAEGVKFGLSFGFRYKQMEYAYSQLTSASEPLRNRLLSSQINSLSSQHVEFLSDVEDAINSPNAHLKEVLNEIFDDMKHSKGAYMKLFSEVTDMKMSRAPKRKRKSQIRESTLTHERVEEEDVESS